MSQSHSVLLNEDCLNLLKTIDNNSVDLAILDPPYNVGADIWDTIENYFEWMVTVLEETMRVLKLDGSLYLWGMSKNNDFLRLKLWMDDNIEIDFKRLYLRTTKGPC